MNAFFEKDSLYENKIWLSTLLKGGKQPYLKQFIRFIANYTHSSFERFLVVFVVVLC